MNKVILISELAPDFLIQGFGMHQGENQSYAGKVGGHDIQLFMSIENVEADQGDSKILCVGSAEATQGYRSGDVLMTGSDDLLDCAFQVMDEMEQRGVVVGLNASQDPTHLYIAKEDMAPFVQEWKNKKLSFLCLWMVDLFETDRKAKLLAILRKILTKAKGNA